VCEKRKGSRKIHAVLGVSHTLWFQMPGTKNPAILSSHSQKTKEKEQTNKTANFKCNSGSQQQLTPHNPMNETP
jgi:hypothetical protein